MISRLSTMKENQMPKFSVGDIVRFVAPRRAAVVKIVAIGPDPMEEEGEFYIYDFMVDDFNGRDFIVAAVLSNEPEEVKKAAEDLLPMVKMGGAVRVDLIDSGKHVIRFEKIQ